MRDTKVEIKLLNEILDKKRVLLSVILSISENQETLINQPSCIERVQMFREMASEKQKKIDEVLACDTTFQTIFDEIKQAIENNKELFKPQLEQMQITIDEVLTTDVAIRAQEKKNREQLSQQMPPKPEQVAVSDANKQRLLSQYKQFSKDN